MTDTLLAAALRHVRALGTLDGTAATSVPGLSTICSRRPSGPLHDIYKPHVCLLLQGKKRVSTGARTVVFSAGDSLLLAADASTVSEVTQASASKPYVSLAFDLDLALIAELTMEMNAVEPAPAARLTVTAMDAEVEDAALRLLRLIERPASLPILHAPRVRELHYWLLTGNHGPAMRRLGWLQGSTQRISRAVALLRAEYANPLPVDRLAAEARMSMSSFHRHFRAGTSLSPLQYQKQLRLIEARRMILAEGHTASRAALAVGYESVSQFTREYGRKFGVSPIKDRAAMRGSLGMEK